MAAHNSILLIIKQHNGIDQVSLLNKLSQNYASMNSARAALSRALKDLSAVGLIQKKDNAIFVTDKGNTLIHSEMKNKLLLKLNTSIKQKDSLNHIDEIVSQLSTLIARAKADSDLLKAAKGSTDFYLSDLNELSEGLDRRIKQFSYLDGVLKNQITALQELNFYDARQFEWASQALELIKSVPSQTEGNTFTVECLNESFFETVKQAFQPKVQGKNIVLEDQSLPNLLMLLQENHSLEYNTVNLYFATIRIRISFPQILLFGPYQKLEELQKAGALAAAKK